MLPAQECAEASDGCLLHRYVLKNLMRDWGTEGAAERSQSYGKVVAELKKRLLPSGASPPLQTPPRVLVPGAGLGRLCVDIASLGCAAQVRYWQPAFALASACNIMGKRLVHRKQAYRTASILQVNLQLCLYAN